MYNLYKGLKKHGIYTSGDQHSKRRNSWFKGSETEVRLECLVSNKKVGVVGTELVWRLFQFPVAAVTNCQRLVP